MMNAKVMALCVIMETELLPIEYYVAGTEIFDVFVCSRQLDLDSITLD